MRVYSCANCSKEFEDYPSKAKFRKNHFCSRNCHDDYRRHRVTKSCAVCGKEWEAVGANTKDARRKTCSKECHLEIISRTGFKSGDTPWNYKRWKISTQGYVFIHMPDHPNSNKDGYVKRANLVVEESIGRYLSKEEVVHHIDGDKKNDNIDNLMLFSSNSDHIRYHYENGLSNIQGAP